MLCVAVDCFSFNVDLEGRNLGRRIHGSGIEVKEINSGEWQLEIVQNTTFADKDLFFFGIFKKET